MPTFGSYQTLAELHRGPFGSLYSSRRGGQDAPTAVKTCRPPADVLTDDGVTRVTAWFLESARLQQQIASSNHPGAANWLKVHDFTRPENNQPVGEAYLVADLAARGSVAKLISPVAAVDEATLYNVARGIVQGLLALRATVNRAHGNLQPSNVLLLDDGAAAVSRVALSDPAPAGLLGPNSFGDDLHALGRLLYALAMHREHGGGWPLSPSPMWGGLSSNPQRGQAWRELTNRLLDPSLKAANPEAPGAASLTLDQLAEMIGALAPGAGAARNKNKILFAVAATLVLAGAVGVLVFQGSRGPRPDPASLTTKRWNEEPAAQERWQAVCDDYYDWLWSLTKLDRRPEGPATLVSSFPKRRDLYAAAAPELIDALKVYGEEGTLQPGAIADLKTREPDFRTLRGAPTPKAQSDAGVARTEELQQRIGDLKRFFAEKWPAAALLKQSADDFAAKGWTAAAERTHQLRDRLSKAAEHGEQLSPTLDEIAAILPTLKKIGEARNRLDAAGKALAAAGDPVLAKFPAAADSMIAAASNVPSSQDAVVALLTQVEQADSLAKRLTDYLAGPYRSVDAEELRKSPEYAAMAANTSPDAATFDAWIKLADQYPALPKDQNPIPAVVASLGQLNDSIARYNRDVAPSTPMDARIRARIDDLQSRVSGLSQLGWTKKNRDRIESDSRALSTAIASAKSDLDAAISNHERDAAESLEQLISQFRSRDSIVPASPAIDADWRTRRDAVLADRGQLKKEELSSRLRSIQQGLRELDQQIPPAPSESSGGDSQAKTPVAAAILAERDRWIGEALKKLGPSDVTSSPAIAAAAAPASAGFTAWLNETAQLRTSLAQIENFLNNGYGLHSKPANDPSAKTVSDLWAVAQADPLLAKAPLSAAAAPLRARVEDLASIDTQTESSALIGRLTSQADPSLAVAAWERLGTIKPAWPATGNDLAGADAARQSLTAVIKDHIPDPARRAELATSVARDLKQRWQNFALQAFDKSAGDTSARQSLLQSALSAASAFGIDDATSLDPRLRFNLLADQLRKAIQSAPPDDPRAAAANTLFLNSLAQLPADFTRQPAIANLISALTPLREAKPNTIPTIDITRLGPGASGLRPTADYKPDANLSTITFDLSGTPLTFLRVEYDRSGFGPDVVYLSRTEVSIEQCAKLIAKAGLNRDRFLALSNIDPSDPSWPGPRGWSWSSDRTGFQPSPYWVAPQSPYTRTPYFAPGLAGPTTQTAGRGLADAAGGNPRGSTPVECISASAAASLAANAGCRLPTVEEWRAAYTQLGPTDNSSWNLRDRTFQRQYAYIEPIHNRATGLEGDFYSLPDEFSFAPAPGSPSLEFDDGALFFRPVDAGAQKFPNLVGNVAEFVTAKINASADAPVLIIGGSALSDISKRVDETVPTKDATTNYADVGFRLAFSATGSKAAPDPLAKQIADRLTGFPFLFE